MRVVTDGGGRTTDAGADADCPRAWVVRPAARDRDVDDDPAAVPRVGTERWNGEGVAERRASRTYRDEGLRRELAEAATRPRIATGLPRRCEGARPGPNAIWVHRAYPLDAALHPLAESPELGMETGRESWRIQVEGPPVEHAACKTSGVSRELLGQDLYQTPAEDL